jgi:hypothetical protein
MLRAAEPPPPRPAQALVLVAELVLEEAVGGPLDTPERLADASGSRPSGFRPKLKRLASRLRRSRAFGS